MKALKVHIDETGENLTIISLYDKDSNYKGKIIVVGKRDKVTVHTGPTEDIGWIAKKPTESDG